MARASSPRACPSRAIISRSTSSPSSPTRSSSACAPPASSPLPDQILRRAFWTHAGDDERGGLPAYEISNHARPGAESRHNLIYWRYGEYAGVGPGAHGRLLTVEGPARAGHRARPGNWLAAVEAEGHGLVEDMALAARSRATNSC